MPRIVATLLFSLVSCSSAALAQDARGYAGGGLIVSLQPPVTGCQSGSGCPRPPLEGTAWGLIGELGWFAGPTFALGGELSLPQRFDAVQSTAIPNERTEIQYRDVIISGVAKLQSSPGRAVRVAGVFGGGAVQESRRERSASAPFGSPIVQPYGPFSTVSTWAFGFVLGADLEMRLASHLSVAPQLRVHLIDPSHRNVSGPSSVVWRPGVVARARF